MCYAQVHESYLLKFNVNRATVRINCSVVSTSAIYAYNTSKMRLYAYENLLINYVLHQALQVLYEVLKYHQHSFSRIHGL